MQTEWEPPLFWALHVLWKPGYSAGLVTKLVSSGYLLSSMGPKGSLEERTRFGLAITKLAVSKPETIIETADPYQGTLPVIKLVMDYTSEVGADLLHLSCFAAIGGGTWTASFPEGSDGGGGNVIDLNAFRVTKP